MNSFTVPTEFADFVSNPEGLLSQFADAADANEDKVTVRVFLGGDARSQNKESLPSLADALMSFLNYVQHFTKSYVWFKDSFHMQLVVPEQNDIPPHFEGVVSYGDGIDDEWFVAYMLIEASKAFPHYCISIEDGDGQFLMIEAADFIPDWMDPSNSGNRVWIKNGKIRIIPLDEVGYRSNLEGLSISAALGVLNSPNESADTEANPRVQKAIFARTTDVYPARIEAGIHRAACFLPHSIAALLSAQPQLISVAVEAFCTPTSPSKRSTLATMSRFGPMLGDLTVVVLRLTRLQYAKLQYQPFHPPKKFHASMRRVTELLDSSRASKAFDLGCRIVCGLETAYRASLASKSSASSQSASPFSSSDVPRRADSELNGEQSHVVVSILHDRGLLQEFSGQISSAAERQSMTSLVSALSDVLASKGMQLDNNATIMLGKAKADSKSGGAKGRRNEYGMDDVRPNSSDKLPAIRMHATGDVPISSQCLHQLIDSILVPLEGGKGGVARGGGVCAGANITSSSDSTDATSTDLKASFDCLVEVSLPGERSSTHRHTGAHTVPEGGLLEVDSDSWMYMTPEEMDKEMQARAKIFGSVSDSFATPSSSYTPSEAPATQASTDSTNSAASGHRQQAAGAQPLPSQSSTTKPMNDASRDAAPATAPAQTQNRTEKTTEGEGEPSEAESVGKLQQLLEGMKFFMTEKSNILEGIESKPYVHQYKMTPTDASSQQNRSATSSAGDGANSTAGNGAHSQETDVAAPKEEPDAGASGSGSGLEIDMDRLTRLLQGDLDLSDVGSRVGNNSTGGGTGSDSAMNGYGRENDKPSGNNTDSSDVRTGAGTLEEYFSREDLEEFDSDSDSDDDDGDGNDASIPVEVQHQLQERIPVPARSAHVISSPDVRRNVAADDVPSGTLDNDERKVSVPQPQLVSFQGSRVFTLPNSTADDGSRGAHGRSDQRESLQASKKTMSTARESDSNNGGYQWDSDDEGEEEEEEKEEEKGTTASVAGHHQSHTRGPERAAKQATVREGVKWTAKDDGEDYDEGEDDDELDDDGAFFDEYQRFMEEELSGSTLKESFQRFSDTLHQFGGTGTAGNKDEEDSDDNGDDYEKSASDVDVELNFLKYLLESHAAQMGAPGPASQLFSQLGIQLPHLPPMNTRSDT